MKGIILAGGSGTRLYPLTQITSKQLLPIYDKPMIYYPLSILMFSGIKEILIITTGEEQSRFQSILSDGSQLGISISYAVQEEPRGIADAFLIAEDFIQREPVCLILGDNVFYGDSLPQLVKSAATLQSGAINFAYYVKDPSRYGVVEFDKNFQPCKLIEKPNVTQSNWALTGLYFYDAQVVEIAKSLKPSARGELEITDVNQCYLDKNQLQIERLGRGMAWLDTGTQQSLLDASNFVQVIESRQGQKIACIEEIAYRMGYIDANQLLQLAKDLSNSQYGQYLQEILDREVEECSTYSLQVEQVS